MIIVAAISYMVWAVLSKTHWMQDFYVMDVVKNFLHIYFSFVFGVWLFCTGGGISFTYEVRYTIRKS